MPSEGEYKRYEREWVLTATEIHGHEPKHETFPLIADGALIAAGERIEVVPKARLQQVEAELEHEKVLRQDALEYQNGAESQLSSLREIIAEKDLIIKASEQHTQYWEDKCAE